MATASNPPAQGLSVVVPVLNDRDGLAELLDALAEQQRAPDELIVVDGGSVDGSPDLVSRRRLPFPSRVLRVSGVTVAAARNHGVRAARAEWIASTDAGCRPVPGWLAAIEKAGRDTDFIAGVVVVDGDTALQRALAVTHYPSADEIDRQSRLVRLSHALFGRRYEADRVGGAYMAFRTSTWEAVGGFPEDLDAAEDRAFSSAVVRAGFRTARVPEAAVHWRPPETWRANARMFVRYARSDVRIAGRGRHAVRAGAWLGAGLLMLRGGAAGRAAVAVALLANLALPVVRARRARLPLRDWWRIPAAILLKDMAQIAGAGLGLADRIRGPGSADGAPPRT